MFIWDFVAAKVLGQIVDWFYSQIVGFLGNFFSEMGNMGAELFTMDWVQSIVLFFSYLAWALYGTGLVVACFETGVEYSSGRGNIRETALNAIKGFMAVSLFTVVPVRLYELSVSLQGTFTAALTGYGTSIGDVAGEVMQEFNAVESISDLTAGPLLGFGSITSGIMILFCLILMAYGVCDHQGLLRQSEARRHPAHSDRRGKPLYVQRPSRIYGRLYPMVQADHRLMPVGVLAGDDPCRRTYGVQGSCPVRAWPHALCRRDPPYRRSLWTGYLHQS